MTTKHDPLDAMLDRARSALTNTSVPESRAQQWSERARALARLHVTGRVLWALVILGLALSALGYGFMVQQQSRLVEFIDPERGWAGL